MTASPRIGPAVAAATPSFAEVLTVGGADPDVSAVE